MKKKMSDTLEQFENERRETERRYSEFNALLQKIRGDERMGKKGNGLVEQLQERDKLIRMHERKIIDLSDQYSTEVNDLKRQIEEMKAKTNQIDQGIESERKRREETAAAVNSLQSQPQKWILPPGLCDACREKYDKAISTGQAIIMGDEERQFGDKDSMDESLNQDKDGLLSDKIGGFGGKGYSTDGNRNDQMNSGGQNVGGGGTVIVQDQLTMQKLAKCEKEMKMLSSLTKMQEDTINDQRNLFKEVISKQQTSMSQQKQEQEQIKAKYEQQIQQLTLKNKELEILIQKIQTNQSKLGPGQGIGISDQSQVSGGQGNKIGGYGSGLGGGWVISEEKEFERQDWIPGQGMQATTTQTVYQMLERLTDEKDADGNSTGQPLHILYETSAMLNSQINGKNIQPEHSEQELAVLSIAAEETAGLLCVPPWRRQSLPFQRLLTPIRTGFQPALEWTIGVVRGIYIDKITSDSAAVTLGVGRTRIPEFTYQWLEEKYKLQNKAEASRWALLAGIEIYRKDFPELFLFSKFINEEFTSDELAFFLYSYQQLFEGVYPIEPANESENYKLVNMKQCRKCVVTVFEGASDKKIKQFFTEFDGLREDGREVDASVFLSLLLSFYRSEFQKRREALKTIFESALQATETEKQTQPETPSTTPTEKKQINNKPRIQRGLEFLEVFGILQVAYPQTSMETALSIYRDAFRLSGCQRPMQFSSFFEACMRNNFFIYALRLPSTIDVCEKRVPLPSAENGAALRIIGKHLALMRPCLEDRIKQWSLITSPAGVGISLRKVMKGIEDALAKKEGRKASFAMMKMYVMMISLQLAQNECDGCISFSLPLGDASRVRAYAEAINSTIGQRGRSAERDKGHSNTFVSTKDEKEMAIDNTLRQLESVVGVLDPIISPPSPATSTPLLPSITPPFNPTLSSVLPSLGLYSPLITHIIMPATQQLYIAQMNPTAALQHISQNLPKLVKSETSKSSSPLSIQKSPQVNTTQDSVLSPLKDESPPKTPELKKKKKKK
ncbi:MAG: hypothetical protein EZS28_020051 [Streblomastix strix]|uniref:Uncharacterized protein n=1 Tax=Streblomastix strix TaxID=222440 RepID=A0A5J4VPF2_9EUKA|nr:MAG: hypothetical protein EZS28_020051 [Streblomastix strix]